MDKATAHKVIDVILAKFGALVAVYLMNDEEKGGYYVRVEGPEEETEA